MREPAAPMPLAEFQRWMKASIRPAAGVLLRSTEMPLASPAERMSVYTDGYLARMREALAEVYEAVRFVLGERAFAELSDAYAARHPSRDYNLSFAGRSLPAFLADSPLTVALPFLPQLAQLEWSVCQAFHAFERPPLKAEALAGLTPEEWGWLRLEFQPALSVVGSSWPILDIWAARRSPRDRVDVPVAGRAQQVMVFRRGLEVRCETVEEPEGRLLSALIAGRTLGEACAGLGRADPADVERWFGRWVRVGLMTRVDLRSCDAYGTLRRE
jgi:hypothetical protein